MTYRVIQWYTGDIACRQVRYLRTRPDMEIVGAVAFHPEKEGLDLQLLEEAAKAGNSSLMGTGNMPGLINDALPLFAAGFTRDITRITTWQSSSPVLYGTSAVTEQLGIGRPAADMADPDRAVVVPIYEEYFRQSAHLVVESLGLELEDFRRTEWQIGVAPHDVYLDALDYTIAAGTVAGFQIGFTGFVAGRPFYSHTVQHTWSFDIGEDWRDREDEPEWLVTIEGSPSLKLQMETTGGSDPWKSANVLELNASRMVNLIPAVCAADPGCAVAFGQPFSYPPGHISEA